MSTREFTTLGGVTMPPRATNPFPGLRPFETDEYRLFFGREGQSDALLERVLATARARLSAPRACLA